MSPILSRASSFVSAVSTVPSGSTVTLFVSLASLSAPVTARALTPEKPARGGIVAPREEIQGALIFVDFYDYADGVYRGGEGLAGYLLRGPELDAALAAGRPVRCGSTWKKLRWEVDFVPKEGPAGAFSVAVSFKPEDGGAPLASSKGLFRSLDEVEMEERYTAYAASPRAGSSIEVSLHSATYFGRRVERVSDVILRDGDRVLPGLDVTGSPNAAPRVECEII